MNKLWSILSKAAKAEDFLDDEAQQKKHKKEMQEKKADEEAMFFLKTQFIQDVWVPLLLVAIAAITLYKIFNSMIPFWFHDQPIHK